MPDAPTPWHQHPDPAVGKSQAIRLIDIAVLGPAMIAVGATGVLPRWARWPTIIGGVLTIAYNVENYRRVRQAGLGGVTLRR